MQISMSTLRKFEIFKELTDRELENFLEIAKEAVYEEGQRIFAATVVQRVEGAI